MVFIGAGPAGGAFAETSAAPPAEGVELNWDESVHEAIHNHPDLIAAHERLEQVKLDYVITRGALFPDIESYVDSSRNKPDSAEGTDSYSYGLTGRQLVYDGWRLTNELKAAQAGIRGAEEQYETVSASVRLRLRVAFLELLRIQELINLTEFIAQRREQNLNLVRDRFNEAREQATAVRSFEASLEQARFEVQQARRRLTLAQRQLAKELGWTELRPLRVNGDFKPKHPYSTTPDFAYLAENNPRLKSLDFNEDAARYRVGAAAASWQPQVYLNGSAGRAAEHWPPEEGSWSAGLSVSLPIFDGGARTASVQRAESTVTQLGAEKRSSRDALMVSLEQNWNALQDALGSLKVEQTVYESTLERAINAQQRYMQGNISFDDWSVIENDFVRESKVWLDTRSNAAFTEANWTFSKGWTLEEKR